MGTEAKLLSLHNEAFPALHEDPVLTSPEPVTLEREANLFPIPGPPPLNTLIVNT